MDSSSTPYRNFYALNTLLGNRFLLLGLRVFLGLAFVVASVDKVADPIAFGVSVANYKLLPDSMALLTATLLPWVELLCGLALLAGVLVRGSSLLLTCLLLVFIAAVLSAMVRGLDITCGCFTWHAKAATIGWNKVLENLGFLIASLLLLYGGEGPLSLDHYLVKRFHTERESSPEPRQMTAGQAVDLRGGGPEARGGVCPQKGQHARRGSG